MPAFRTLRKSARLESRQRGEEFAYRPLDDHEIRLVVLLPGSFSSQIECNLVHHKFDEALQYDALSYTWGDPTITDVILLDGHTFKITRGLEHALRYIRLHQDRRVLWIDAICINQRDCAERSHQVQKMFDIYQNAETVRSWIGCKTESDDYYLRNKLDVFMSLYPDPNGLTNDGTSPNGSGKDWKVSKLLEAFGKPSSLDHQKTPSMNSHNHICPPIAETFRSRSGLKAWCDMGVLVSRPYWTRSWIQQEISTESKVIIHFGKLSFPLTSIYNHCRLLSHFAESCDCHSAEIMPTLVVLRNIMRLYTQVYLLSMQGTDKSHTGKTLQSILNLLQRQSFRRTTDPRDKIYALVGLIPQWRDGRLSVDYRLSVRHVYAAAVKSVAELYNTLDHLITPFAIPKGISLAELPSWCPDWSKVVHMDGGMTMAEDICFDDVVLFLVRDCDASRNGPPKISFANDDQILTASGLRLDIVQCFADCEGGGIPFTKEIAWKMIQHAAGLARSFIGGPYWTYWRNHGNFTPPDNEKHLVAAGMKEAIGK
jgi:hypothetical protein